MLLILEIILKCDLSCICLQFFSFTISSLIRCDLRGFMKSVLILWGFFYSILMVERIWKNDCLNVLIITIMVTLNNKLLVKWQSEQLWRWNLNAHVHLVRQKMMKNPWMSKMSSTIHSQKTCRTVFYGLMLTDTSPHCDLIMHTILFQVLLFQSNYAKFHDIPYYTVTSISINGLCVSVTEVIRAFCK